MGLPLSVWTMGDSCLLSSLPWRKTFSDYIFNRNKEEKKETKNNSPGYLSLSCASLGTWELPALSRIVVSSRRHRNLISRGANSLRPSLGCTCFRLDQLLASASWVSHILCPSFGCAWVHVRSAVEFPSHASSANFLPWGFEYVCVIVLYTVFRGKCRTKYRTNLLPRVELALTWT